MFWIIFIVIGILIFTWMVCVRSNTHEKELHETNNQLSAIEHHGNNLINDALSASLTPLNLSREQTLDDSRNKGDSGNKGMPLDLISLRNRVLSIIMGTYHVDKSVILYLRPQIDQFLVDRMNGNLNNAKSVSEKYNPNMNNKLVLIACETLMEHSSLDDSIKILVAQYIINKTRDGDEIYQMYDWIVDLASDPETSHALRAEAVDVLIRSNNSRYMKIARKILDELRHNDDVGGATRPLNPLEINIQGNNIPYWIAGENLNLQRTLFNQFQARLPKTERTVYNDGQNTHNTEINNSVLEAAANIIKSTKDSGMVSFDYSLLKDVPTIQKTKVEAALHRITTDSSTFKHGTTLYGLFQAIQKFINQNPHKNELNQRLIQELTDMNSTCSTGHMSRLVNVIQGFETVPEQKIKIDIKDEVYAKISHLITQALKKPENEKASDAMIMGDNQAIVNEFVASQINNILNELINEYKDIASPSEVKKQLVAAAKTYTKTESFALNDDRIMAVK